MKWVEEKGSLIKEFEFADFQTALHFVNQVGAIAEHLQHHPDICLKDYKKVIITTTTHDAGNTITEKDYRLAAAIDTL